MPGLYRDQGVVLRTIKLGEADRIISFMTQGHGKVRAVAKGVRKSGSRFGARLEPTSHVALQCYRGRELDVVTQVETIDANRALRESYVCITHAVPMLEAVDQVAQEQEPAPALYRMLVGALRTLSARPSPVVTPAFFWKLLSLGGLPPVPRRVRPLRRGGGAVHRVRPRRRWGPVRDLRPARWCAGRAGGAGVPRPAGRRRAEPRDGRAAGARARPRDRAPRRPRRLEYHSERRLRSASRGRSGPSPAQAGVARCAGGCGIRSVWRECFGRGARSPDYPVRPWPAPT